MPLVPEQLIDTNWQRWTVFKEDFGQFGVTLVTKIPWMFVHGIKDQHGNILEFSVHPEVGYFELSPLEKPA
jgi:hypothetical protein